LLALFIRANLDPNIPYHYDPGKNVVYARAALDSFPLVPQYNPYFNLGEYYEYQVLFPYTVALLHTLTGFSLIDLTAWLAILAGAALCLTVYWLAGEIFRNTTAALISAFLIATSEIQLLAYMNYYPQILALTLMPVAAVFVIRSVRYQQYRYFFLAALVSALIILASYLAAAVCFIIMLVSLGIWCIRDKNAIRVLIAIPVMTTALLAFFWLPMAWRHGIPAFMISAFSIFFTPAASPFTNQPFTLWHFVTFSSTALIAIILGIIILFLIRKIRWDFEKVALAVCLLVSLVLMGSYLVKPILWVDRYSQFFDVGLCLLVGGICALLIKRFNARGTGASAYKGYLLLLLLLIPLYGACTFDVPFGKWGYSSDLAMTEYLQSLPPGSLVVTPPGIQGFWVSAASGVHILGGESSQMIGHEYFGDSDSDTIINDPDLNRKLELIRRYGVNYIVLPIHAPAPAMWNPPLDRNGINAFNNANFFEMSKVCADEYGTTLLIKVRGNLTPRYHTEERNQGVTILGYLISIASLLGFAYVSWRETKGIALENISS